MDNDLMARRLRPPSQPARPMNGHTASPSATAPWATRPALPEPAPHASVPWDHPDPEPWPPTSEDETTAEAWPPTTDAVAEAPQAEAVAEAPEAEAVAAAPDVPETEAEAEAPEMEAVAEVPETESIVEQDNEPAADQFVAQAADTAVDDSAWGVAPTAWETTATDAWADTVPWDAETPSTNGHEPDADAGQPVEAVADAPTMVDETTDGPSANVTEWSAEEAAGEAEMAVAEAVSQPDDAPWETAAEAVVAEQDAEPTEAVADGTAEAVATDSDDGAAGAAVEAVGQSDDGLWESAAEALVAQPESEPTKAVTEGTTEAVATDSYNAPWATAAETAVAESATEAVAEAATTEESAEAPVEAVAEPVAHSDDAPWESAAQAVAEPEAEPVAAAAVAANDVNDAWDDSAWGMPAQAPTDDQRADDQPVAMVAAEPETQAETVAPVAEAVAPVAEAPEDEDVTDSFVDGQAPWDIPEPFTFNDETAVDDRPTDYFASYDDMFPVVTAAVAAATETPTADLDDAFAPVLNDVEQTAAPNWTIWQPPVDSVEGRMPNQPAFKGKIVGPTPPDGLFGDPVANAGAYSQPTTTVESTIAFAGASGPGYEVAAEVGQALTRQLPALYSTGPANPQQPLIVRIELTIVDESNKLRSAEMARRVGPWSDGDTDADSPTPRHPEFEPRTHLATADETPVNAQPAAAMPFEATPVAAAPVLAPPSATPPVDVAAAPEAQASVAAQPQEMAAYDPWNLNLPPVDVSPDGFYWVPAVTESPSSPVMQAPQQPVDVPWAIPALEHRTSNDPLSSLPAATFGTASVEPAHQSASSAYDSEAPVKSVSSSAAPVSASQTAALAAAKGRPGKADQADLWFLAAEPEGYVADQSGAAQAAQSSTLLTVGLTITMAVVVIILVLVFIQLMTSLLK